jgi:hypothetical protein
MSQQWIPVGKCQADLKYTSAQPVSGLPDPMPMLLAAQETYDSAVPMDETAAAYGVELTSLEAFVRQQVSG